MLGVMGDFTTKQSKFIAAYAGNATKAAREAGYSGNAVTLATTGKRLLRNVQILAAIKSRETKSTKHTIATRQDRQNFWSEVMHNKSVKMSDRLRAAELLGKSEADFTENVKNEIKGGVEVKLTMPANESEKT